MNRNTHKKLQPTQTKSAANQPSSARVVRIGVPFQEPRGQTRGRTASPGPPQSPAPLTVGHPTAHHPQHPPPSSPSAIRRLSQEPRGAPKSSRARKRRSTGAGALHNTLKLTHTKSATNQTPSRASSPERHALPGTAGQTRPRTASPGPPQSPAPLAVGPIQQCPIARLIPFPQNARTHSARQIQQVAASIAEFGFVNPLLIRADYTVIAGHARLQAARHLGLTAIPVIVLAHLSVPSVARWPSPTTSWP